MMTDPLFPHLGVALEPARMQHLLQRTLLNPYTTHGQEYVVDACLIGEKRYKPGKSCVLSYDLRVQKKGTGSSHTQVVAARLCRPMEGLLEFQQEKQRKLSPTPGIEPLGYVSETEMLVWAFPNDRKLTSLPQLLDIPYLKSHLPPRLEAMGLDHSCEITAITTEVLHYLPERSCMIRYHVTVQHRPTGNHSVLTIYGKTYRDDSGAETYSVMRQLAEQWTGNAVPLAYDRELRTLWQSHVSGESVVWEMSEPARSLNVLHATGKCLAAFHGCRVETPHRFGLPDIEASLGETIQVARRTYPEVADRIQSIVNRLLARRNSMSWTNQPVTPIHRDLKMGNFLIDGEQLRLIDMDCVCIGDPLTDMASLITNLHLHDIRAGRSSRSIRDIVEAFCSAYTEVVPYAVSVPHLHWYTAAAFIHESTRRTIRQLDNERLKHIADYLELSEYYMAA